MHNALHMLAGLFKLILVAAAVCAALGAGALYGLYRLLGGRRLRVRPRVRQRIRERVRARRTDTGGRRARRTDAGERFDRTAATETAQAETADEAWELRVPGLDKLTCPQCHAPLAPDSDASLCPACYADLKHTCPGCGEAVSVQRRICPHCRADLRVRH